MDQTTREELKRVPTWMCGYQKDRASAIDNTGETRKDTLSLRIEIKIADSTGNRTRDVGLKGKDSTDHAMAMDIESILSLSHFTALFPDLLKNSCNIMNV